MTELWRDIPGEPDYQVSNKGGVRNKGRRANVKGGTRSVRPRILSCFLATATGYPQVDIRGIRHSVHRLVALAWCEGYFPGAVVDHLNGIRDDNRPENLEWVTYSENTRRGFERGRINPYKGVFSSKHPTSKSVVATCMKTGVERLYPAAMDAVREGFSSSAISKCCTGVIRYHKGFYWRHAEERPA